MNNQNVLTEDVRCALDIAAEQITKIDNELWDEATYYLVSLLEDKASKRSNHFLFGMKYLADVKEHLTTYESTSAYQIIRKPD